LGLRKAEGFFTDVRQEHQIRALVEVTVDATPANAEVNDLRRIV
jgi:hypothetical protein